jgi:GNAT superfamily N-acetyltransferase
VELNRFYLVQDWVGQGAGSRLMQACLEEARQTGHDIIWLGVWEKNDRAIAFYRKWDFVEVGRHPFLLGEDLQVDLVMQRRL